MNPRSIAHGLRLWLPGLLLWAGATLAAAAGPLQHGMEPPGDLGGAIDQLVDQRGQPFSLDRVAGRPALLFFGFTHCGSTCPVALLTAVQVLADFGRGPAPAVLFVTLDPLSDGPRELASHLGRIDARITGLTGHPDRVERIAERYGVAVRPRADGPGPDHSSMWYLLDGRGRLQRVYRYDTPAAPLIEDLRRLSTPRGTTR